MRPRAGRRWSGSTASPASASARRRCLRTASAMRARTPATLAFWSLHRRRAERAVALLRTGLPSPRAVDIDRYALRAAVLVGLIATGFIAGPEKYARVAAAFDWRFGGFGEAGQRIDAWVDPPAYTGRPPIVLTATGRRRKGSRRRPAPSSSSAALPASRAFRPAGARSAEAAAASAPKDGKTAMPPRAAPPATKATAPGETRLVLKGDAKLTHRVRRRIRICGDPGRSADDRADRSAAGQRARLAHAEIRDHRRLRRDQRRGGLRQSGCARRQAGAALAGRAAEGLPADFRRPAAKRATRRRPSISPITPGRARGSR